MFNQEYWDRFYNSNIYMFGEEPNSFLKEKLEKLPKSNILFPAEGEGRNAVYAAKSGWKVTAFDLSEVAKQKAETLADKHNVKIDYKVGDIEKLNFEKESFGAMALIFAHFQPEKRMLWHKQLGSYLKKGAWLIIQGFGNETESEKNKLYYDYDQLKEDFNDFEFLEESQKFTELNEGVILRGKPYVISILARKNS